MQYAQVLHQAEAITALHVQAPAARVGTGADQQVRQAQEAIWKKDTDMALPFCLKQSRIIATNGDNTYSQHAGSLTQLLMGRWQARTAFERDSRRGEVEQAMKRPVQQLSGSYVLSSSSSDDSGEEDV